MFDICVSCAWQWSPPGGETFDWCRQEHCRAENGQHEWIVRRGPQPAEISCLSDHNHASIWDHQGGWPNRWSVFCIRHMNSLKKWFCIILMSKYQSRVYINIHFSCFYFSCPPHHLQQTPGRACLRAHLPLRKGPLLPPRNQEERLHRCSQLSRIRSRQLLPTTHPGCSAGKHFLLICIYDKVFKHECGTWLCSDDWWLMNNVISCSDSWSAELESPLSRLPAHTNLHWPLVLTVMPSLPLHLNLPSTVRTPSVLSRTPSLTSFVSHYIQLSSLSQNNLRLGISFVSEVLSNVQVLLLTQVCMECDAMNKFGKLPSFVTLYVHV